MTAEFLLGLFVQYGYWIVFVGILLDNAGLPLPGELLLLTFGAVARTGNLHPGLGVFMAWAAAVSGDSVGYWLGRIGGDRALHTYCRVTLGSGQCVSNARSFYERHGRATVVFGRFVMGVRAFLTPLASRDHSWSQGIAARAYLRDVELDGPSQDSRRADVRVRSTPYVS